MTTSRKDHILRVHNQLRNRLALGEIRRLGSASRMPALRWSDELARSAESKARACARGDECTSGKYIFYIFSGRLIELDFLLG